MKLIILLSFSLFHLGLCAQKLSTDKDLYQFILDIGFVNTISVKDSTKNNIDINEDVIREKYPQFINSDDEVDFKKISIALIGAIEYLDNQNKSLKDFTESLKTDIENIKISNENEFKSIKYKLERIQLEIAP